MKQKFALLLSLTLLFGVISGCVQTQEDLPPAMPTTVTIWTYYNGIAKAAFDGLVDEFNQTVGKEQNIVIDAYSQGDVNQLAEAVLRSANKDIGSEPMPHIFASYTDSALTIDQMGLIANLEDYFTAEELSLYREEFLEDGRFGADNGLKILPVAKSSENIFVNSTYFDRFSAETGATIADLRTWESIAETAANYYAWTDAQTPEPCDGKALFGVDAMANFMLIASKQLGTELYDVQGTTVRLQFPKDVARKLWDAFYVPLVQGHYSAVGRFRSDDAKTGGVLAYSGSTAGAAYFPVHIETGKDTSYPIDCAVAPFPTFSEGDPYAVHQGAGMAIVKSDSAHEKAAATFLKWFTEPAPNLKFATLTGYLPVQNAAFNLDVLEQEYATHFPGEENSPSLLSAKATFSMLQEYKLYSNKPFAASYDARKVLESSLRDYAKADREIVVAAGADEAAQKQVLDTLLTDANFEKWYAQITEALEALLLPAA